MEPQARAPPSEEKKEEKGKLLLEAIYQGERSLDTVLELLENGVNVETKDDSGTRALTVASGLGHSQIVQTLLLYHAKIHIPGERMKAPLVAAASHGHISIVKLFKELGIDDWERRQSLLEAVQNGHLPVVAELLVTPRDLSYEKPDGSGIGYLGSAAQNGHLNIVAFLLSKGASQFSLKPRWTSPLHQAAEEGHTAVARALVKHDAASLTARNADGCTPLLVACFRNKAGVAEYLASKMEKDDLDIRADNRFSALFWAVRNDNVRLVHKLLERRANPDGENGDIISPLHLAIWTGRLEIAADLLDHQASVHGLDREGKTSLHLAAASPKCLPLIQRLLDEGLDVNAQSHKGFTPLQFAVLSDSTASVEILLNQQADPNKGNYLGITPLHAASAMGNIEMVELLLSYKAKVDAQAYDMRKPIHVAAAHWKSSVVRKLLASQPDLSEIDGYGMTVWEYAGSHEPTLKALQNAPAKMTQTNTAAIESVRSRSLSDIVERYHELCIKEKNRIVEEELIAAIISILFLEREVSLIRQFNKAIIPSFKSRHGSDLRFTCFNCQLGASFSELHRCFQCFPVELCKTCYEIHVTGIGMQQCSEHEIVRLFDEVPSESQAIEALGSILERILKTANPAPKPDENQSFTIVSVANSEIPELDAASSFSSSTAKTSDLLSPSSHPGGPSQTEGLQEEAEQIKQLAKAYISRQNNQGRPVTAPFAQAYMKFAYKSVVEAQKRYSNDNSASYSIQDLDNMLAKTIEVIYLYKQPDLEWIQCNRAFLWFCRRRISMNDSSITLAESYISVLETFLSFIPTHDTLEAQSLLRYEVKDLLADLYNLQYKRSNSRIPKHFDDAIRFKREALSQDISPSQKNRLIYYTLGGLLFSRYRITRVKDDIVESVDMFRTYCELVPEPGSDKAHGLHNLGCALHQLWVNTGAKHKDYLEEAQINVQEAVQMAEQQNLSNLLTDMRINLVNIRNDLHQSAGTAEQLEQTINSIKASLAEPGISADTKAVRMANLAYHLKLKYETTTTLATVEEGINVVKEAFSLRNIQPHTTCLLLNSFTNLLQIKYRRGENSRELWDLCVRMAKIQIVLEPYSGPRLQYMHSLAVVLTDRYEEFEDIQDLQKAIDYGLRCLQECSISHSDRSMMLSALARRFEFHYKHSKELRDLDSAVGLSEIAVRLNPANEVASLTLGTSTLLRSFITGRDELRLAVDRFEACYQNTKLEAVYRMRGAINGGISAMDLGEYSRASKLFEGSVSLLREISRPLLDLKDLQYVLGAVAGLSERIASARLLNESEPVWKALHAMESARGIVASFAISARTENRETSMIGEMNEKSYMALAENGPIITFAVSRHKSSAIIVTSTEIRSIDLPFLKYKELEEYIQKYLIGNKAITKGSGDTYFERTRDFQQLLKWLWTAAVQPVLEDLGFHKDYNSQAELPRIWWVSSGLMGAMPLHAAGTHSRGSRENTISYVVSSYTATLRSLRYSRQRITEINNVKEPVVMAVAMPKTDTLDPLEVDDEIAMLEDSFPKTVILSSPTVESVFENMSTCNIGHFICHGISVPNDPSKSGLVLSSGTLTLGKLSQKYYPNAHIMYLSACSTAEVSVRELLDEVLHLGTGFQLVGFSHVVATLWEVENREAGRVAQGFYERIRGDGKGYLGERVIARALHDIVKKQRDKQADDPLAWAAQIHFGP